MMNKEMRTLQKKIHRAMPGALVDACGLVADQVQARAGSLANGVGVDPVRTEDRVIECGIHVEPIEGEIPPSIKEYGSSRQLPNPFLRPVISRAKQIVGDKLAHRLRGQ